MSPYQHGEVFVTDDGAETDLDLGHYERFVDENLSRASNVTTGQIYAEVIGQGAARRLPGRHDPGHPARHQRDQARASCEAGRHSNADVVIVEVGGTVGDIEGLPFLEAIRQMRKDVGANTRSTSTSRCCPTFRRSSELKTKPTQHSVRELRGIGIQPDVIVCRSDQPVSDGVREKIALFCDVEHARRRARRTRPEHLRGAADAGGGGGGRLHRRAAGPDRLARPTWPSGGSWSTQIRKPKPALRGGAGGQVRRAGRRVHERARGAAPRRRGAIDRDVEIDWMQLGDAGEGRAASSGWRGADGIVVPGGFGERGIEGKIVAARYAREHRIPYLGLCLGMQVMCIEFARNVLRLARCQQHRVRPQDALPGHRPDARSAGDRGHGRHDAAGAVAVRACSRARLRGRAYAPDESIQRAPPPPLGVQQRLPRIG